MTQTQQNMMNAMEIAMGGTVSYFVTIIGKYVAPLFALACLVGLLFTIFRTGFSTSQMKENIETHLMRIAMLLIVFFACTTWTVWAYIALGMSAGT